jgi:hypothetical protein
MNTSPHGLTAIATVPRFETWVGLAAVDDAGFLVSRLTRSARGTD